MRGIDDREEKMAVLEIDVIGDDHTIVGAVRGGFVPYQLSALGGLKAVLVVVRIRGINAFALDAGDGALLHDSAGDIGRIVIGDRLLKRQYDRSAGRRSARDCERYAGDIWLRVSGGGNQVCRLQEEIVSIFGVLIIRKRLDRQCESDAGV